MIRHLLCAALLAGSIFTATAADDMYMHVRLSNGTVKIINTDDIHRITFKDNKMVVTDESNNELASLSHKEISHIAFDESSVDGIEAIGSDSGITVEGCCLNVDNGTNVAIYNAAGQLVAEIENAEANIKIDISDLAAGVYIVKSGAEAIKIAVK